MLRKCDDAFQSTLPAWGATVDLHRQAGTSEISIHAPRVGSDRGHGPQRHARCISIHAPRVGSDLAKKIGVNLRIRFQSTLPAWGATVRAARDFDARARISIHAPRVGSDMPAPCRRASGLISIHAPRVGSDICAQSRYRSLRDFNPRSPRGERHSSRIHYCGAYAFQSTLPAWGATTLHIMSMSSANFNPRSPRGERLGA